MEDSDNEERVRIFDVQKKAGYKGDGVDDENELSLIVERGTFWRIV